MSIDQKTILKGLCVYDPRSPHYIDPALVGCGPTPARDPDCACDPCFRGKDELAVELLDAERLLRDAQAFIGHTLPSMDPTAKSDALTVLTVGALHKRRARRAMHHHLRRRQARQAPEAAMTALELLRRLDAILARLGKGGGE